MSAKHAKKQPTKAAEDTIQAWAKRVVDAVKEPFPEGSPDLRLWKKFKDAQASFNEASRIAQQSRAALNEATSNMTACQGAMQVTVNMLVEAENERREAGKKDA